MELSLNMEGDKKLQYLKYCMHRIKMLRHYKITPVVVFDGGSLPCKAATQDERNKYGYIVSEMWISYFHKFEYFETLEIKLYVLRLVL